MQLKKKKQCKQSHTFFLGDVSANIHVQVCPGGNANGLKGLDMNDLTILWSDSTPMTQKYYLNSIFATRFNVIHIVLYDSNTYKRNVISLYFIGTSGLLISLCCIHNIQSIIYGHKYIVHITTAIAGRMCTVYYTSAAVV